MPNASRLLPKISARIASDDGQSVGTFNAAPWFADDTPDPVREGEPTESKDEQIELLFAFGLAKCERVDSVVFHPGCASQNGVVKVFHYLDTFRPKTADGAIITFEAVINKREALLWLREHRYRLWEKLYSLEREEQEDRAGMALASR